MGAIKKQRKFNPRPKIDYPPVPTRKWIPPDQRPRPKPQPKYEKPKGISQKLKISSLKRVWHLYDVVGEYNDNMMTGNFAQTHKRFTFKTNGHQGPCNCAVACCFARFYKMAILTKQHINQILLIGDHLYARSIQQGDRCWIEIPPEKVFKFFFLGLYKIAICVDEIPRIHGILTSVTQAKAKQIIVNALEEFFQKTPSGMFNIKSKYIAIWVQDGHYCMLDPTEHDELGQLFFGRIGDGFSLLLRCKTIQALADRIYGNFVIDSPNLPFQLIQSGVSRIIKVNVTPPETFEEITPIDRTLTVGLTDEAEPEVPMKHPKEIFLEQYIKEIEREPDPEVIKIEEISPEVTAELSVSRRPSWLQDEGVKNKNDVCYYPLPVRPRPDAITYFNEVIPQTMGILRASTCQTDKNFSKYGGRQSMGNAVSVLAMLRIIRSSLWIPKIVDTVLRYGDILFSDAMKCIPRSQSLKLSDFQRPMDYESRKLEPKIDPFAVVGKLDSQDHNVIDLKPALEEFLADNDCCIILGPQILAVWIEDDRFYMFDPNERDHRGQAIPKNAIVSASVVDLEVIPGVACVTWYKNLEDLVATYIANCEKSRRAERFYLSKVQINDYVEKPPDWNNFKGVCLGKWILRGTFSEDSNRFPEVSKGFQGPANCVVAITMQTLVPVQYWTTASIDEILYFGNETYIESIRALDEKGVFVDRRLLLNEIKSEFNFEDKLAKCEMDDCYVNGVINPKNASTHLPDIKKGLEEFFRDKDHGVITVRNLAFAIWRAQEAYFCFDPYCRDEEGLAIGYGPACAVRFLDLSDMAQHIEANLCSKTEDIFNINGIKITLYDTTDEGISVPLNSYARINHSSAILRSYTSEDSEKFGINAGLQTVPMCVTAVTFNKLKPSSEWTKTDFDDILNRGDKLYLDSMIKIKTDAIVEHAGEETYTPTGQHMPAHVVKSIVTGKDPTSTSSKTSTVKAESHAPSEAGEEPEAAEPDEIPITSENVRNDLQIGPNKFTLEFEQTAEGTIVENLREAIQQSLSRPIGEESNNEVLLETKPYSVVMWRDEHVYYVFDPKPRDKFGCPYGKDDYPDEPPPPPPEIEQPEGELKEDVIDEEGAGDAPDVQDDEEREEGVTDLEKPPEEEPLGEYDGDEETDNETKMKLGGGEGEEGGGQDLEIEVEKRIFKSPSYWKEQERMNGKACVIWFSNLDDLVKFIYTNIPTDDRINGTFTLKTVKVNDELQLKDKLLPEDERNDVYAGNWYDFIEIEHGRWILRGNINLYDEMFPADNRGRQLVPTAVVALACVYAFGLTCFHKRCIDSVVTYGDKYHTFIKRLRKKQLLQDAKNNLQEGEIDWLLRHEEIGIEDIVSKVCIFRFLVDVKIEPEVVTGDIKAQSFEEVLDLKRGLEKFFEENRYGILCAKGLSVAIWRGEKICFMFDGLNRGPNGIKSVNGTACLTRYLGVEKLAEVFLANLPVVGKNTFVIHKITMRRDICPRSKEAVRTIPKRVCASAGQKPVIPGKSIVRGSFSQEDPKFGRGPNAMSAPIAIIALTMTLIHKSETWSRPIIDEVLLIGSELYDDSAENLGYDFNPWDRPMDIYNVKNDYRVGILKANCELRHMDQKGIIDTRDAEVNNIRQGIENFFKENTHGIIVTDPLTVAIWEGENDDGDPIIYMFDPNPRSQTGMPLFTGTACLIACINAEMAADHFIGCILDPEKKKGEFRIVPVEIVVGKMSTKKRLRRIPTRSSLPRCSNLVASETKKRLRRIAEEDRKRKEERRIQAIGRHGYSAIRGTNEAIIRGYRSPNSEIYCPASRGNQDIPSCIVALVMQSMIPVDSWNHKHVDLILDTGDQLYVDSYIAYAPKDPKLGMENVMRKFFMKNLEVHVTIYKPIISSPFTVKGCEMILSAYFQQEQFCIFNYKNLWVAIVLRSGYFYVFDPHDRDIEGNFVRDNPGTAVVIRFENLNNLALKLYNNLVENVEEEVTEFTLWLLAVSTKP